MKFFLFALACLAFSAAISSCAHEVQIYDDADACKKSSDGRWVCTI